MGEPPYLYHHLGILLAHWSCYSNVGVLQTTVAEMVTVQEHQRRRRCLSIACPS